MKICMTAFEKNFLMRVYYEDSMVYEAPKVGNFSSLDLCYSYSMTK